MSIVTPLCRLRQSATQLRRIGEEGLTFTYLSPSFQDEISGRPCWPQRLSQHDAMIINPICLATTYLSTPAYVICLKLDPVESAPQPTDADACSILPVAVGISGFQRQERRCHI